MENIYTAVYFPFLVIINSRKLIFLCEAFVGISDRIQCNFLPRKMTEINESAHADFAKPMTIALMIALQVENIV